VERSESNVLHELLETRLQDKLAEALHQIKASEQHERRAEIPAVQHGRVAEQHEDGRHARRRDDDRLNDLEQEVQPVFELVLELGPEEQSQQAQVADHQAPTALYCRTPTRPTPWKAKEQMTSH